MPQHHQSNLPHLIHWGQVGKWDDPPRFNLGLGQLDPLIWLLLTQYGPFLFFLSTFLLTPSERTDWRAKEGFPVNQTYMVFCESLSSECYCSQFQHTWLISFITSKFSRFARYHDDCANMKSPARTATLVPKSWWTVSLPTESLQTSKTLRFRQLHESTTSYSIFSTYDPAHQNCQQTCLHQKPS